uniref:CRISPR system Cms protein Csm5 n=1 Tax=Fervidobacterium pennivorans TaxID=93466 RepID=A0A7V4KCS3_FERPE
MNKNSTFSKRMIIEPLSPVFIGSGEKVGKFETLVDGNKTYILNFDKLMENDKFVAFFVENMDKVLDPSTKDGALKAIFKHLNLSVEEYSHTSFPTIYDKNGKPKTLQISRFVNTAGRFYIPGSSIKGAIRTALIKANESFAKRFESTLNVSESDLKNKVNKIEDNIFGSAQLSPFKALIISDSSFIDKNYMKFKKVEIIHLERPKQGIPQFFEVWLPEQRNTGSNKVESRITFKADVLNKLLSQNGARKEAIDYLMKVFESEENFIKTMKEAARVLIEMEKKKINTSNYQQKSELLNFYEKISKINNETKNGFVLRIGGHSGFYSKTAYRRFLQPAQVKVLKSLFGYRKVKETNFPVTTRIVKLSESPKDILPVGWIKVELLD